MHPLRYRAAPPAAQASSPLPRTLLSARAMSTYESELLRLLESRGHLHQITDPAALDARAKKEIITGYVGFDPTASSLHIGNLASIMLLKRLQQAGHRPIVIMGGGTAKVGDPSGKDETRTMLTEEKLAANIAGIKGSFEKILRFDDSETGALLINNDDWLSKLGYIELLRAIGPHFTINRMMTFDSVKLRLEREQPLSFLEFNYMIMQAYDFLVLAREYDCVLQMGGSDQWGNIVNGMELNRRIDGRETYGVTQPLITRSDGAKMGKSVDGAIWLNEDALPAYDFWQYWRNTDDRDVGRFLKLFTDIPLDEIARLEKLEGAEINDAKIILANAVTALVRGEDAAKGAEATARETFAGGGAGEDLPTLAVGAEGMRIGAVLTEIGFTASNGEAKRKLAEGAVKLDGETIKDPGHLVAPADGESLKLSLGKKKHGLITR